MSTQIRNAGMVSLLETDFIKRNEPGNLLGNIISTYQALPGLRGFWPISSTDENGDVYDFSDESISALLKSFLNPNLNAVLDHTAANTEDG